MSSILVLSLTGALSSAQSVTTNLLESCTVGVLYGSNFCLFLLFSVMSTAPSDASVRIVDLDDDTAQDTVPQGPDDEVAGSEPGSDGQDASEHDDLASNASEYESGADDQVNGDGTRAVSPPSSPPASQSKAAKAPKDVCEHHKNPDDPHQQDLCEGCKIRYGIELCTLDKRCKLCVHLSPDDFTEAVLAKRELNLRKKNARHRRNKERQLPHRTSPRFSSSLSDVVRTDVPLSPSGTTVIRLDSAAKARIAEEAKFRPSVSVTHLRFDI